MCCATSCRPPFARPHCALGPPFGPHATGARKRTAKVHPPFPLPTALVYAQTGHINTDDTRRRHGDKPPLMPTIVHAQTGGPARGSAPPPFLHPCPHLCANRTHKRGTTRGRAPSPFVPASSTRKRGVCRRVFPFPPLTPPPPLMRKGTHKVRPPSTLPPSLCSHAKRSTGHHAHARLSKGGGGTVAPPPNRRRRLPSH